MATPFDTGALLAEAVPGDNVATLTVAELSGALKRTVEDAFGHVRVRAEVSGFKRHVSGHCYLTLKDDRACLDAVIWKGQAAAMRFRPEDGIEVIATGRLTTYPGRSRYQLVIDRLELAGKGALMALLDRRRQALAAEGLFDEGRKRPLPFLPRRIGVVTSPTGAVIRDILHRLADRCPTDVLVWPVAVQGEAAAGQVAAAIAGFALLGREPGGAPDLIIVARGGGSIEDLWAFNEEAVVRAVAASPIPVISAVGHETDTTLCDFAADRRAPTPTAAAEMAVPVRAELRMAVAEQGARIARCAHRHAARAGEKLAAAARRMPAPEALAAPWRQRLDDLADRGPRALGRRLAVARGDLAEASGALRPRLLAERIGRGRAALAVLRFRPELVTARLAERRRRLEAIARLAASLHPERPLARGYAWVSRRDGGVVATAAKARAAGHLTLHFADGTVDARAETTRAGLERGRAAAYPPAQPTLL